MTPKISVIVSTRNRPDDVAACAKTILANQYPAFELVIVDQSNPFFTRYARPFCNRQFGPSEPNVLTNGKLIISAERRAPQ